MLDVRFLLDVQVHALLAVVRTLFSEYYTLKVADRIRPFVVRNRLSVLVLADRVLLAAGAVSDHNPLSVAISDHSPLDVAAGAGAADADAAAGADLILHPRAHRFVGSQICQQGLSNACSLHISHPARSISNKPCSEPTLCKLIVRFKLGGIKIRLKN